MKFFQIHAENPQDRLIKQAVDVIRKGGVIIYPTDSSYALGCRLGDKAHWIESAVFVSWMINTTSL